MLKKHIIDTEKSFCCLIFFQDSLMNKKFKRHVFTVSLDQFNASLKNKKKYFKKKKN